MSNTTALEKAAVNGAAMSVAEVWSDSSAIRQQFGQGLTDREFGFFMGLGAMLGANPFTREIWAIKYGSNPAQIILGRDFYRRKAQEHPDYNGHTSAPVYENDKFVMVNGQPSHEYRLTNRGALVGAYCVVHKKSTATPYSVFVELREYHTGQSLWKNKPATMISKVAEAQALRGAFAGLFNGTYSEDEQYGDEGAQKHGRSGRTSIGDILGQGSGDRDSEPKREAEEAVYVEESTGEIFGDEAIEMATPDQMAYIAANASRLNPTSQKKIIDMGDAMTKEYADATIQAIIRKGGEPFQQQ